MDKKMTIKERFLFFAETQGISKVDFYKKIGVAASNFKGIGMKSDIGSDKIVNFLSSYPEVSAEWLLMGKGNMFIDKKQNFEQKSNEDELKAKDNKLNSLENRIRELQLIIDSQKETIETQKELIKLLKSQSKMQNVCVQKSTNSD
jgi:hypothetical protein